MWGAMELHEAGREQEREYVRDMRPTPIEPAFTWHYFDGLIDDVLGSRKRSVKGLLTQDQLIPGLGNSIAQDIHFRARLHPRRDLASLDVAERRALYEAIEETVQEAIDLGGRDDEVDLYGRAGGYRRLMSSSTAGGACPDCGRAIEKIQYLGGACYLCPSCQV
jgi:formamidopyrimidine-DNA glycosylase